MRTITYMGVFTAIFVAALPFFVTHTIFYGEENIKFFAFIAFVDVLLLWSAAALWTKKLSFSPKGKWFLYASILVLAVEYLASIFGVNAVHSFWSDIIRSTGVIFITHVLIGSYLLAANLEENDWSMIRKTVAISGAVFSFMVFLGVDGFGLSDGFLWFNFSVPGFTIANTTFAAAYAVLALIVTLIEISRTKFDDGWRYGLIGCVAVLLLSPLLIGSNLLFNGSSFSDVLHSPSLLLGSGRSSSVVAYGLMLFMGGIVLLRKLPGKIKNASLWGWAALWLIAITVGLSLLFTSGSFVQKEYIKTSTAARILLWDDAMKGVADKPILGWGPENFVYAFEAHFDNRLYSKENNSEIWFDRGHNVFVDTLVGSGIVGVLAFVLLVFALWFVVYRAHKKGLIGYYEAVLLAVLPIAHIVQHQTAFDTVVTYALLSIIGGYLFWLEYHASSKEGKTFVFPKAASQGLAVVLLILALISAKFVLYDQWIRQNDLYMSFYAKSHAERLSEIQGAFSGPADFEMLRLSSAAFTTGLLDQIRNNSLSQAGLTYAKQLIDIYAGEYQSYIQEHPNYYRARLDYAYLLFMKTMLGDDSLDQAKAVLVDAYPLAPGNPLTYGVDALAETYGGHFPEAKAKADAAIALNPNIDFTKIIRAYIDDQQKSFPTITILELENI